MTKVIHERTKIPAKYHQSTKKPFHPKKNRIPAGPPKTKNELPVDINEEPPETIESILKDSRAGF